MPRVVHFEIHAENPERAARFYEQVFGWKLEKWAGSEEYWLITTGPDSEPGINGGLMKRRGSIDGTAVIAYVCTIDVPNVDTWLAKVIDAGGAEALPKMPIYGVGWLAYCKDTDGNIFGITERDPMAGK